MVVIRLSRGGSKHRPFYNVVVLILAIVAMAVSLSGSAFTTLSLPRMKKGYVLQQTV